MVVLVLTILMFQLKSFQRVLLVLSVAPLGLIGAVAALLLAQAPLGFVAILGVLALGGMIARNSVILIDQIETKGGGQHPWDAVVTAAIHRTRPILLTASAATLGMIPIAPTVFWGPMAFAIIGGLTVATVLTLIFLPALYVAWFRIAEPGAAPRQSSRPRSRHMRARVDVDQGDGALRGLMDKRIGKGNVMPQASEALSVAELFAEREARRRSEQEAAGRFQRRKEEELTAYKQRLENFHLVDEMIPAQLERLKRAFERGESQLMVASFPCDFCTDGGRAVINAGEPPIKSRPRSKAPDRQSSPTGC